MKEQYINRVNKRYDERLARWGDDIEHWLLALTDVGISDLIFCMSWVCHKDVVFWI